MFDVVRCPGGCASLYEVASRATTGARFSSCDSDAWKYEKPTRSYWLRRYVIACSVVNSRGGMDDQRGCTAGLGLSVITMSKIVWQSSNWSNRSPAASRIHS